MLSRTAPLRDATRTVLSPRFAAKRFFGSEQDLAVKFAVGRYAQFVHSLRDEELPLSNDTWILADQWVPQVVSDEVQLGVEAFWDGGWSGSLEAYLRRFDGVTSEASGAGWQRPRLGDGTDVIS